MQPNQPFPNPPPAAPRPRFSVGPVAIIGVVVLLACVYTWDHAGPGDVALLVDSYGLLSLAVARGSAAEALRLHAGDAVTLEEAT